MATGTKVATSSQSRPLPTRMSGSSRCLARTPGLPPDLPLTCSHLAAGKGHRGPPPLPHQSANTSAPSPQPDGMDTGCAMEVPTASALGPQPNGMHHGSVTEEIPAAAPGLEPDGRDSGSATVDIMAAALAPPASAAPAVPAPVMAACPLPPHEGSPHWTDNVVADCHDEPDSPLAERVTDLQQAVQRLLCADMEKDRRIAHLEAMVAKQHGTIQSLRGTQSSLTLLSERVSALEDNVNGQAVTAAQVHERLNVVNHLPARVQRLEAAHTDLTAAVRRTQGHVAAISSGQRARTSAPVVSHAVPGSASAGAATSTTTSAPAAAVGSGSTGSAPARATASRASSLTASSCPSSPTASAATGAPTRMPARAPHSVSSERPARSFLSLPAQRVSTTSAARARHPPAPALSHPAPRAGAYADAVRNGPAAARASAAVAGDPRLPFHMSGACAAAYVGRLPNPPPPAQPAPPPPPRCALKVHGIMENRGPRVGGLRGAIHTLLARVGIAADRDVAVSDPFRLGRYDAAVAERRPRPVVFHVADARQAALVVERFRHYSPPSFSLAHFLPREEYVALRGVPPAPAPPPGRPAARRP